MIKVSEIKGEEIKFDSQNNTTKIPAVIKASSSVTTLGCPRGDIPLDIVREGRPIRQAVVRRNINFNGKSRKRNVRYANRNVHRKERDSIDGQEKKKILHKPTSYPSHQSSYVEGVQDSSSPDVDIGWKEPSNPCSDSSPSTQGHMEGISG